MAGLLGIGVALILGIATRITTVSAVLLLAMMYLASFPLETNPIIAARTSPTVSTHRPNGIRTAVRSVVPSSVRAS